MNTTAYTTTTRDTLPAHGDAVFIARDVSATHATRPRKLLTLLGMLILAFSLVLASPAGLIPKAYAAAIEDCDLDGYDDHTGNPVPWPGFDSTRGDEVPSDWDGVSGSYEKPAGAGYTGPAYNAESGGKTNKKSSSSSGSSGGSAGGSSGSKGKNVNSSSGSTSSGKTDAGTTTTATTDDAEGNPVTTTATPDGTAVAAIANAGSALATAAAAPVQTNLDIITTTIGTLEVSDSEGAVMHAGGSITVYGSDFAGNVEGLEIEIHSTPHKLGTTATDGEGAFEYTVNLPENLKPGKHSIVVLYQGRELTRQPLMVGPKAASTFWQALTVGFTQENKPELLAGVATLAGLVVAGSVALTFSLFSRKNRGVAHNLHTGLRAK